MKVKSMVSKVVDSLPGDPVPRHLIVVQAEDGRRFYRHFISSKAPDFETWQRCFEGETDAPELWKEIR